MQHHPKCPIYGDPKWAHVDECGPCDVLNRQELVAALQHDPLCPHHGVDIPENAPQGSRCQCLIIAQARADERAACVKIVEGAYIVNAERSRDWNVGVRTAVEYLTGAYDTPQRQTPVAR